MRFDYEGRRFAGVVNYDDGDLNRDTRFHYRQKGEVVWGTYEGGGVAFGTLVARMDAASGLLDMRFSHVTTKGSITTGTCISTPEVLAGGRYRLHEDWQETSGARASGTSVVEELSRSAPEIEGIVHDPGGGGQR